MKAARFFKQRAERRAQAASLLSECATCHYQDDFGCKFTTEYANYKRRLSGNSECAKMMTTPTRMFNLVLRGMPHPNPAQCKWSITADAD